MNNQTSTGELLIYCLGMKDGPPEAGELKRLTSSDWDGLIRGAIRYNVAPLLYHRLKGFSAGGVIPADAIRKLRESYLNNALKNVHLYQDLSRVIRAFQSKNIPVIVLKGAHLAKVVYGNIALRPMCDMDLLVKKSDLSGTVTTLMNMGYSPEVAFEIEDTCANHMHLPLFFKESGVPIEIHWHIERPNTPFFIDIDELWKRAQPVIIDDLQVLVLSPEDLILHLCLHATRHILKIGPGLFCDLPEVIRHYQGKIDWSKLQQRSREWKAERPLYLMLSLLKELSGEAMPKDLLSVLKSNPVDMHFVAVLRSHIIMKIQNSSALPIDLTRFCTAASFKGKTAIFLEILKKVFPSKEHMAKIYHVRSDSTGVYFYYPLHLVVLILRNGHIMPILWQIF